jgi:beta-N-acetylhexosaminidase
MNPKSSNISLDTLPIRKKIAQLFLMGFRGSDMSEGSEVYQMIQEVGPGAVILFDQDMVHHKPVHNISSPKQLQELCEALHKTSSLPLWIGIDQEGGLVNRLKPEYGFPETKSHAYLGKQDNTELTYQKAKDIGSVLREMHISINFAPVVDIAKEEDSSIIAKRERSFGRSSDVVYRHAKAYLEGLGSEGIWGCCKHFPGHGSAKGDTHAGFVDVTETWEVDELLPYSSLIEDGLCSMIMSAHVIHKDFDTQYPVTLSEHIMPKLLREKMGFDGLVFTDDMQMRAISDHYGIKEALKMGLNAGVDMFCFGNNLLPEPAKLFDLVCLVEQLLDEDLISENRIDYSVSKILTMKGQSPMTMKE